MAAELVSYLNSSCIRKKYQFNAFEFPEREIHAFAAKLSGRCFCLFPAADSRLYLVNGFDFY